MSCILQKAHALIGNVEENHCDSQHTACSDNLHIQHIGNANEQENQHLAADALKADLTGEVLVRNGTHYPGDIINHHKGKQCVEQTVTAAKELAKPAADACKYKLNAVPEFFHDIVPPFLKNWYEKSSCPQWTTA